MVDEIIEYWASLARELAARFNIEEFDKSSDFWNWKNFSEDIRNLRNKFGFGNEYVDIMGLRVDFDTGETLDLLTDQKTSTSRVIPHLYYHSKSQDKGVANEWVKYNALSGSWACRYSFDEKDVKALADAFVNNKEKLFEALKKLGAKEADFGDAAFELPFLPMVKVLLVFEEADEEFPASVRLLYDKNSIFYMPHEQLGDISWFLASRVLQSLG
ncbi:MAG: DUF3786 domain-containing protein [Candidatus Thorarchaeota archaeon]|nr:DUF3786 domain-containing protein [Candidatus Thorarchaeota archaeon]MCK5240554.1 DUF3786 domain-containing protein [Candidatus Thorarchaeota archaeon]